jgi:hypothetical protein
VLRDEAHLLSVGAQHSERGGFTELKDSIGRLHAEGAHEDSSTLNGEKHPQVGHELHFASYRDEVIEGILLKHFAAPTGRQTL